MRITRPIWSSTPREALPRLTVDGRDTGLPLWVASNRRERNKGLLGTDGIEGALWIPRCNWVHCLGMRYAIDVVYVRRCGAVVAVAPLAPGRIGPPRLRAGAVVEMEAGMAERLGIGRGSVLGSTAGVDPAGAPGDPAQGSADGLHDRPGVLESPPGPAPQGPAPRPVAEEGHR